MDKLTNEQVLELVERIVGDEFCEDLDMMVSFGPRRRLRETRRILREAGKKLVTIYRIVHGHRPEHRCHGVHDAWRREAVEMFEGREAGKGRNECLT